jgi:hypothetical protein
MGQLILAKIREWYIVGIALIVLVGGLYAGSVSNYSAQPISSSVDVTSAAQGEQPAGLDTPAQIPRKSAQGQATDRGASDHPNTAKVGSQPSFDQGTPAARPADAPASHNHAIAEKPAAVAQNAAALAQSTGQATNQSASAPALSADADAGRQVTQSPSWTRRYTRWVSSFALPTSKPP